jgi:hypothetical protein
VLANERLDRPAANLVRRLLLLEHEGDELAAWVVFLPKPLGGELHHLGVVLVFCRVHDQSLDVCLERGRRGRWRARGRRRQRRAEAPHLPFVGPGGLHAVAGRRLGATAHGQQHRAAAWHVQVRPAPGVLRRPHGQRQPGEDVVAPGALEVAAGSSQVRGEPEGRAAPRAADARVGRRRASLGDHEHVLAPRALHGAASGGELFPRQRPGRAATLAAEVDRRRRSADRLLASGVVGSDGGAGRRPKSITFERDATRNTWGHRGHRTNVPPAVAPANLKAWEQRSQVTTTPASLSLPPGVASDAPPPSPENLRFARFDRSAIRPE